MQASPHSTNGALNGWLPPVVFLLGLFVFYLGARPLFDDPDMPWHLATGKLLLDTYTLPATDPWSFASNGAPWFILSWLWNILLGMVERISGLFGAYIFGVTFSAAVLTVLAQQLVRRGIEINALLLTIFIAMIFMVEFASPRPQLAGYALTLAFMHILHKSRRSNGYGSLRLLPLLMLVWANSHGSFIVGFTLLAAYIIESHVNADNPWRKRLAFISAACVVAALLNPYSLSILSGAMQSIDSDAKSHIIEWQPFSFGKSAGLSAWLIIFIFFSNIRNREAPLADKILAFSWLLAMFFILRNAAIFMLVSAPYLASCISVQTRGLQKDASSPPLAKLLQTQPVKRVWRFAIGFAAIFIAAVFIFPHENRIQTEANSVYDAIDYIKTHEPERRYLSDFDFGGQIIYKAAGDIAFFMDSRSNTAYRSREMQNYLAFWLQKPGWEEKIKAYGINGIIVRNTSLFSQAYDNGHFQGRWKLVFAGNTANVYIAAP